MIVSWRPDPGATYVDVFFNHMGKNFAMLFRYLV